MCFVAEPFSPALAWTLERAKEQNLNRNKNLL